MTLQEKYIQKVLPYLMTEVPDGEVGEFYKNGAKAYNFPCPFCWGTTSKDRNKRKRVAVLLPTKECKHVYVFYCNRHGSAECQKGRSFENFLWLYKPKIAEKYKFDKEHT